MDGFVTTLRFEVKQARLLSIDNIIAY